MASPPPGWYDDPARSGRLRYWDGNDWTDHLVDRPLMQGPVRPVEPVARAEDRPSSGDGTVAASAVRSVREKDGVAGADSTGPDAGPQAAPTPAEPAVTADPSPAGAVPQPPAAAPAAPAADPAPEPAASPAPTSPVSNSEATPPAPPAEASRPVPTPEVTSPTVGTPPAPPPPAPPPAGATPPVQNTQPQPVVPRPAKPSPPRPELKSMHKLRAAVASPTKRAFAGPTAADGTPLAAWWRRLVAWLVDEVVAWLIAFPVIAVIASLHREELTAFGEAIAARTPADKAPMLSVGMMAMATTIGLVVTLVYFFYESILLSRSGATPGRRLVKITVRHTEGRPLTFEEASKRSIVKVAGRVLGGVAALAALGNFLILLDMGRGLLDRNRRTFHDLAATTEVVCSPVAPAAQGEPSGARRGDIPPP